MAFKAEIFHRDNRISKFPFPHLFLRVIRPIFVSTAPSNASWDHTPKYSNSPYGILDG